MSENERYFEHFHKRACSHAGDNFLFSYFYEHNFRKGVIFSSLNIQHYVSEREAKIN